MSEDNIKYGHQPTTPHPKREELENKEEATRLFESYRLAHGMDNDNVRACLWRKAGVIEVIEHVLELISTREKERRREEEKLKKIHGMSFADYINGSGYVSANDPYSIDEEVKWIYVSWKDGDAVGLTISTEQLYEQYTQSKTTDDAQTI